jgi:predicted MFS family arabinose efflux permease
MLMPGVVAMTALMALAGVFLAPCIACAFILVDRHAPRGTVTEAFSWLVTTFTVGASVGTGLAGPVIEWGGAVRGFAVSAVAGGAALLVLLATGRVLAATGGGTVVEGGSENDRNGAPEPRFSTGHQA